MSDQRRAAALLLTVMMFTSLVPLGASAPANAQESATTFRVSMSSEGVEGTRNSLKPAVSADGRIVAFQSAADNLDGGDTNGAIDIFVRDRDTGLTTRVSVSSDGTSADSDSYQPSLSADGRYVAFESTATNLVPNDTNAARDVFVRDRVLGTTTRASVTSEGGQAQGEMPVISGDGRYVVFQSRSAFVSSDTASNEDIFLHDLQSRQTVMVSSASIGLANPAYSYNPDISADGRFVVFQSYGLLGLTNPVDRGIYIWDRDTGVVGLVSKRDANAMAEWPRISSDGTIVAYQSTASNEVAGDTNGQLDAFVVDRTDKSVTRVSVSSSGTQGDGASGALTLSADGSRVAFGSYASNLVADDANNGQDVFLHNRKTATTTRVSVSSSGSEAVKQCGFGTVDSGNPELSNDGQLAVFESSGSNLVSGDANCAFDIFGRTIAPDPPERPLIVLHGITGAFLKNEVKEVWPDEGMTAASPSDNHLDVLRLASDGVRPYDENDAAYAIAVDETQGYEGVIDVTEVCRTSTDCFEIADAYRPTFDYLQTAAGYELGTSLFPFAFDWRKGARPNAELLLGKIDSVLQQTASDRVDILAHSQGGLVTSAAVKSAASTGKVSRVATLGTPYLGSTKALGVLHYRFPCQAEVGPVCALSPYKAQELVTNWPGFLELLPSRGYFEADGSVIWSEIDRDGDGEVEGPLSWDESTAAILGRNPALISDAAGFHDGHDQWDPADSSVELMRMVGTGSPTISFFYEYQVQECSGDLWWRNCETRELFEARLSSGDGTVTTDSADLVDADNLFDYRGSGVNQYFQGVAHGVLATSPAVLGASVDFFKHGAGGESATSTTDSELQGVELVHRGRISGTLADTEGHSAGVVDRENGISHNSLSGVTYSGGDAYSSYFMQQEGAWTGSWTVTSPGEVDFRLKEYSGGDISKVNGTDRVWLPQGAELAMDLTYPVSSILPVIEVDKDADGAVDLEIVLEHEIQGEAAEDVTAPTSQVTVTRFQEGGKRKVEVAVSADDAGGSGVREIQYGLNSTGETGIYSEPLVLPAHGEIYVRSIDRAGNVESPYAVAVLDDAPSRRELVARYQDPPFSTTGFIDHSGDIDWWGMEAASGSHLVSLLNPGQDFDVDVFDADGNWVAGGSTRGPDAEAFNVSLQTGRHYLRVSGHSGSFSEDLPYQLSVSASL